jgi:microcystin-dependent protein
MSPFLGQLLLVGFNFPPNQWAFCQGQIMSISQNTALFSLLGTYYGGNGTSNFGLPDMQGRLGLGFGQGPGLTDYVLGENGGTETVTVLQTEMALHNHTVMGYAQFANQPSPINQALAEAVNSAGSPVSVYATGNPTTLMASNAITPSGTNQPHNNLMPYQALNWIIALAGVYPTRG